MNKAKPRGKSRTDLSDSQKNPTRRGRPKGSVRRQTERRPTSLYDLSPAALDALQVLAASTGMRVEEWIGACVERLVQQHQLRDNQGRVSPVLVHQRFRTDAAPTAFVQAWQAVEMQALSPEEQAQIDAEMARRRAARKARVEAALAKKPPLEPLG